MATSSQIIIENIFLGCILTLICICGIIGNFVSLIVLCYQERKRSRHNQSIFYFLIGLSICDSLFLFTWLNVGLLYTGRLFGGEQPSQSFETAFGAYFSLIIRPLGYIGQAGGTIFIMAVTLDRYLAVCHSLLAKRIWTKRIARNLSIAIFVLAIVFSIPIWFALEVVSIPDGYAVQNNELGRSIEFTAYNLWLYTSINTIIPFPILIVLNAFIFKEVRQARLKQASMTRSQVSDISLAKMLLCVVLVFCVCNIPAIIRAVVFSTSDDTDLIRLSDAGRLETNFLYTVLRVLDWLGISINSGINFFIYCLMSRTFQKSLIELFNLILQRAPILGNSLRANQRAATLDSIITTDSSKATNAGVSVSVIAK